jgi:hypothetical protein
MTEFTEYAFENPKSDDCRSLSPGERVRVRGKKAY